MHEAVDPRTSVVLVLDSERRDALSPPGVLVPKPPAIARKIRQSEAAIIAVSDPERGTGLTGNRGPIQKGNRSDDPSARARFDGAV